MLRPIVVVVFVGRVEEPPQEGDYVAARREWPSLKVTVQAVRLLSWFASLAWVAWLFDGTWLPLRGGTVGGLLFRTGTVALDGNYQDTE